MFGGALAKQHMKESDIELGCLLFDQGGGGSGPTKNGGSPPPHANPELLTDHLDETLYGWLRLILDTGPDFLLHENLIVKNGIFNLEFMNFETC